MKLVVRLLLLPLKACWLFVLWLEVLLKLFFTPIFLLLITGFAIYKVNYFPSDLINENLLIISVSFGLLLFLSTAHIASWLEKIFSLFGSVISLVLFAGFCLGIYYVYEFIGLSQMNEWVFLSCGAIAFVGVWGVFITIVRFFKYPKKIFLLSPRKTFVMISGWFQKIRKMSSLKIVWAIVIFQCICIALLMFRVEKLEEQTGIKSWLCSEQSSVDTTKKAIVRIAATKGEGTGFIIHPEGVILTNAHVVGDDISPKIIFPDYTFATARVIKRFKEEDIAMLQVDKKNMPYIQFDKSTKPQSREELFIVGYPLGNTMRGEATVSRTQFIAERTFKDDSMTYIQMSSGIDGGFSGSPVINACGNIVGIASNSTDAMSLAIDTSSIISLIEPPDKSETIGRLPEAPIYFKEAFDSPAEAVLAYYDAIRARQFRLAYDLLAKERIQGVPFEEFVKGYANTLDVAVIHLDRDEEKPENVTVDLRAMDLVGQDIVMTYYEGTWKVIKEDNAWKLGSSKIKKIEEEPWWAWWD